MRAWSRARRVRESSSASVAWIRAWVNSIAARRAWQLLDDVGRERLVESLQERVLVEIVDEQGQLVEPELASDRGGDGQGRAAGP